MPATVCTVQSKELELRWNGLENEVKKALYLMKELNGAIMILASKRPDHERKGEGIN